MFKLDRLPALLFVSLMFGAAACGEVSQSPSPAAPTPVEPAGAAGSSPSIENFLGIWRSDPPAYGAAVTFAAATSTEVPELHGCRNFQWHVTSQTSTTLGGELSVECAGGISLVADATGVLTSATTIDLGVSGTGQVPGVGACPFSLDGAGMLRDPDTLEIAYTGTTCLGPVQGSTRLYRDRLFPEPEPEPEPDPAPQPEPPAPPPAPAIPCAFGSGEAIVACIEREFPDRLAAGVSHSQRVANMSFLRDRIIEAGRCGGLDLAWNLKRGVGPHSIDALAWRHPNGHVDVVDIGSAYDDTSRQLRLAWHIVGGPPGYDPYPHPGCR